KLTRKPVRVNPSGSCVVIAWAESRVYHVPRKLVGSVSRSRRVYAIEEGFILQAAAVRNRIPWVHSCSAAAESCPAATDSPAVTQNIVRELKSFYGRSRTIHDMRDKPDVRKKSVVVYLEVFGAA